MMALSKPYLEKQLPLQTDPDKNFVATYLSIINISALFILAMRWERENQLQTGLTSSNFVEACIYSVVCCSFPVPIILKQKLPSYKQRFKSENFIYIALFWKIQNWGTK